ncbi:hypothetical protein DFH09DRAFT_1332465 [Mycena vulgaris]|nr:hypothetical protein DFH09DRAFT_1332465 [Mycena vulgaris]
MFTNLLTEPTTDKTTWPVAVEHREALEGIKKDYSIHEFIVFDPDNSRIDPLDITTKLKGTEVECSFKLILYYFGGDDSSVAELIQIVILRYAAAQLPSPYNKNELSVVCIPALAVNEYGLIPEITDNSDVVQGSPYDQEGV